MQPTVRLVVLVEMYDFVVADAIATSIALSLNRSNPRKFQWLMGNGSGSDPLMSIILVVDANYGAQPDQRRASGDDLRH